MEARLCRPFEPAARALFSSGRQSAVGGFVMRTSFHGRILLGGAAFVAIFGLIGAAVAQSCAGNPQILTPSSGAMYEPDSDIPLTGQAMPAGVLYVNAFGQQPPNDILQQTQAGFDSYNWTATLSPPSGGWPDNGFQSPIYLNAYCGYNYAAAVMVYIFS
jgi:hypothetical protein